MKALEISKKMSAITLTVTLASIVLASAANAYYCKKCKYQRPYAPVAICQTSGTHISVSPYICCKLKNANGTYAWRNTWVSNSCSNADPYARGDMGCTTGSLVYGTNGPIIADCQFSFSTDRYASGRYYYR